MTYDMGNVGPGLGKLQKCAKIKWAYDILTLPVLIIESPKLINIKNLIRFATIQKDHILSQKLLTT